MATYPNNLFEPRNFENLPGLNRLTADKKNLYAEDLNETNAEIVAIETILGKNPNGAYASVKAWLEALASGGGGGTISFGIASFDDNNYDFEIDPFGTNLFDGLVITGYMDGTNTGAVTISINGGTPRACTKNGPTEPLVAGDIVSGQLCMFQYFDNGDGTYWQMLSPSAKLPVSKDPIVRVYTSDTTWSKPSDLKYIEVELVGGGGGGGGGSGTSSSSRGGSGGGSGGYSKKIISVDDLSESEIITIGAGGAGGITGGGNGGTTYFGSILSATGGTGGKYASSSSGSGGSGTGGDINIGGENGNYGASYGLPGNGGLSFLGVLGAGGLGGGSSSGAVGKNGIVIIKEYY
jgi:hypothetical protein